MDEKALIEGCVKEDARAQKMLFDKYASKMLAVCMRYFNNKMEAEDILQEGFIKVFKHIRNYEQKGSFEGWMRRIFVNTALDEIRKKKMNFDESDIEEIPFKIGFEQHNSEDQLFADDLMKIVQALPTGYRTIFNLFAIEGYSHKEIADMLNISESTSKSQYFRAKALLKTQLEKIDFER